MATIPYLIIGPSSILGLIGLLHGPDETEATPLEDWHKESIDVLIPARNEEESIVFCLSSLEMQTIKPRRVILIDDASTDRTIQFAKEYCESINLELVIIQHDQSEGKTKSLKYEALESDANVLFILDADTVLRSKNYIERLVQELYQGVGISCACGVVLPFEERDKVVLLSQPSVNLFANKNTAIKEFLTFPWYKNLAQMLTDNYREELYLFLQKFIYHTEMVFFGGTINPVGCAVAYKREYVKEILEHYEPTLGIDLTTSEDVFIGFAFTNYGYRNIQVQDVYALTQEPPVYKLPAQIFMWSSSFLQCCYYFGDLLMTPFKIHKVLWKRYKEKTNPEFKKILQLRKIKEPYRQAFGVEYTKKYGRPIGWYIFLSAVEKITYPTVILMLIYFKLWFALLLTYSIEVLLCATIVAITHRNRKVKNFFKSIITSPIRYAILMYDIFVILYFIKDLVFAKNRKWKK